MRACPEAVLKQTHAGESVMHLASNNASGSIGILDILQKAIRQQERREGPPLRDNPVRTKPKASPPHEKESWASTSAGNTPRKCLLYGFWMARWLVSQLSHSIVGSFLFVTVHLACFRENSRAHIETLAAQNPQWITVRNNAGFSPLQLLCQNGQIDE